MIEILILLMAVVSGLGAIGDEKQKNRNNFTMICIACILAVAVIEVL